MATAREQQQQQSTMDEERSPTTTTDTAEAYESTHVHAVYEAIAPHFSSTRHSPWPRVAAYLEAQRPGAVGLDVGCGNGKYLDVNPMLHMLGSDRSGELVRLARSRGSGSKNNTSAASTTTATTTTLKPTSSSRTEQKDNASEDNAKEGDLGCSSGGTEVAVADGLALPYRLGAFDFVICIAVVHHLSTRARRVEAIGELLSRLRPSSSSASAAPPTPGGDNNDCDAAATDTTTKATCLVFVWALEQAGSRRGWNEGSEQDTLVPWVMRAKGRPNETFQRYYHLYKKGELEEDIIAAGGVVEESGYERDNWWAVFSRPQS